MIANVIKGFTHLFGKPDRWEGQCDTLHVRVGQDDGPPFCESAWVPTPEEIEQLKAGASIIIRLYAPQPVMCTYVEDNQ